jgi:hypothetical protein
METLFHSSEYIIKVNNFIDFDNSDLILSVYERPEIAV